LSPSAIQQVEFANNEEAGIQAGQAPAAGSPTAIAAGNATKYYILRYRALTPGLFAINSNSPVSGAWYVKAQVTEKELS
jgi:hypothetical protein